jgi:hypothetical protein
MTSEQVRVKYSPVVSGERDSIHRRIDSSDDMDDISRPPTDGRAET